MLNHLLNADSAHDPVHDRLCVRPLGFYAYEGAVPNYVANMFVLGPRDIRTGPFVLYRPFAGDALLEFATWQALLAAINQAGELQETVLAWLDDDARGLYADGGFERPHLEGVLLEGFWRSCRARRPPSARTVLLGECIRRCFMPMPRH